MLAFAAVLAKNDAASSHQPDHSSRGEKVQACRDIRRFLPGRRPAGFFSFPCVIENLPLRDPIRADPGSKGFHLNAQRVEFGFQHGGALVQLKLRKTLRQNRLDLFARMRFEQVQHHRIADDELAVDRLRLPGESFGQDRQIDIGRRSDDGKAHQVFAAASGASGELLNFAGGQIGKVPRFADTGLRDDHRAGWKVDTGGERGRGEDGVQRSGAHQFFDGDFPGRQMSGMVRGDADALDGVDKRVLGDAGKLCRHMGEHSGDLFLPGFGQDDLAALEGLHRFVAGPSRGEKNNRRSEVFLTESRNQINRMDRRRHAVSFPLR